MIIQATEYDRDRRQTEVISEDFILCGVVTVTFSVITVRSYEAL
jgi:hypothetical protein